jgi:hypothetical protein
MRALASLAAAVLLVSLAGCLVIPYRPAAVTAPPNPAHAPDATVLLSFGPRQDLDEYREGLARACERCTFVHGLAARDALFPEGGWSFAELLSPAAAARRPASGADFLVVVEPERAECAYSWGEVVWYLIFVGLEYERPRVTATAELVDLRSGAVLERSSSTAEGGSFGIGLVYGLFVAADSQASARNAVLERIAAALVAAAPTGPIRVAVLAAESPPP